MSRTASRPEVTGAVPLTTQSQNAASSRLNPLSYEMTSSVRHDRVVPGSPPSTASVAGSLRRNGDGNDSVTRRSGANSANSIE